LRSVEQDDAVIAHYGESEGLICPPGGFVVPISKKNGAPNTLISGFKEGSSHDTAGVPSSSKIGRSEHPAYLDTIGHASIECAHCERSITLQKNPQTPLRMKSFNTLPAGFSKFCTLNPVHSLYFVLDTPLAQKWDIHLNRVLYMQWRHRHTVGYLEQRSVERKQIFLKFDRSCEVQAESFSGFLYLRCGANNVLNWATCRGDECSGQLCGILRGLQQ
jgi:hypothetical protein